MTIQRGKDLLDQSNPSTNELRKAILSLQREKKYVENCIELGFREKSAGDATVQEISFLVEALEEKLKYSTN